MIAKEAKYMMYLNEHLCAIEEGINSINKIIGLTHILCW